MTVEQIQTKLRKKVSKPQLYRYFKRCDPPITPIGAVRQKPQQYPNDAIERLELLLGIRIVSMKELRDERRRSKLVPRRRAA
jgi:hypothetical protein